MSNRKKKSNRHRPPPPRSLPSPPRSSPPPPRSSPSPPPPRSSPPPSPPPHPILNLLPPDIRSSLSSLSRQEMEVLAHMIAVVLVFDTSEPTPSSIKAKETCENFPGNQAAQKSPIFGCQFFPCYRTYWERWVCTSSSNRRRIDVAIRAFDKSLQSWKNGNANSLENSPNSGRNDKSSSGGSLPALEEVVEERSDKEMQDSAIDLSAEEGTPRSFAGNAIARLLGFLNPRMWWSRKV